MLYVYQCTCSDATACSTSETTGPELWHQTSGNLDILVGGVGTGGTITGATQFLRTKNPNLHLVAVEPEESPVLSGGSPGPHKIQGIGAGFIPQNCDTSLINEIVKIDSNKAIATSRALATKEGIFVGISSGAAVAAAMEVCSFPVLCVYRRPLTFGWFC